MPGKPDMSLCSMGVYVFNAEVPVCRTGARHHRIRTSNHDFGKDIIPRAVRQPCGSCALRSRAVASWRRTSSSGNTTGATRGTIDAYWDANIDLTATVPALNLYDRNWPVWTYQQQLPRRPSLCTIISTAAAIAIESSVSSGCIVSGEVNRSLLFSGCRVHSYSRVNLSVVLPDTTIGCEGSPQPLCRRQRLRYSTPGMVVGEDPHRGCTSFPAGPITV
jgi:glucose-1-phosphate adenylyltransferase